MYERSLNEVESILSTRKVPLVSVREIWEEVVERSRTEGFEVASLVDFSAMLEGDQRFQIIPAQVKNQDEQENPSDGEVADEAMENLGFFSEDRVRLRMTRVVRPIISDEEEEVGSIRRRAFVSQKETEKEVAVHKGRAKSLKKSSGKIKKGAPRKPAKGKRKKTATRRKPGSRKRSRK